MTVRIIVVIAAVAAVTTAACGPAVPAPATLDTAHDACAYCRMIVSDRRFASQIVSPLEEPKFFDDLGCLANYLKTGGQLPARTMVYVADHATVKWTPAREAVFTRVDSLTAPMGSHVIAHDSAATRNADAAATAGTPVDQREVFPAGLPGGTR